MFAYSNAVVVNESTSAAEFARAGEALQHSGAVVLYGGLIVLRAEGGHIVCEVIDTDPSSHRCAEEFAVMVENARLALADSRLAACFPDRPLRWRIVSDSAGEILELWRA